jgi:hypothetical protein
VPLFDIIESCLDKVPATCDARNHATSSLCGVPVVRWRTRKTKLSPKWWTTHSPLQAGDGPTYLLNKVNNLSRTGYAVLVIEDINAVWYHALAARCPSSLDVKVLAQHILRRGDLRTTNESLDYIGAEYSELVSEVGEGIWRRSSRSSVCKNHHGFHIDGLVSRFDELTMGPTTIKTFHSYDGYRDEAFIR